MYLEKINLLNFKNYEELSLSFCPAINCIVGHNGSGKTTLLDAIHYLSLTKSAFSILDSQSIKHESDFFLIDGKFNVEGKHYQITCSLKAGGRKVVMSDKKAYDRLSEHIGRFPVVMIAPDDTDLIRDGSDLRRKFFDGMISQIDASYLANLLQYNLILKQRNGLLKQFFERNYFDKELLETYSVQLLAIGKVLHEKRKDFIKTYVPMFQKHYQQLTDSREEVDLVYESELFEEDFEYEFYFATKRDLQAQRTTKGIHKDDFIFEINRFELRKFGSQGQQKSFVIALKLAQFDSIQQNKNCKPILLLDDIFDKLDELRINKLLEMMAKGTFGQLFVTDARPERTRKIFEHIPSETCIFQTEDFK
ncbi:DNA replication and repair protein RecF [Rhodocytophaga aerolata]|uniref:DNA replication and repair protein RecF n=1 Tax=Rhodocytophaga aerolata TaxID=455078 RepID=A0ABT8QZ57_9BACT|nr:DNA replication and repair protein RecF [Rhodocytophaga aerolata]MDO1445127.1 DNA replication and repair protein RecF [Rhodocytophaga aerolata]